jgi:hypothetical protein
VGPVAISSTSIVQMSYGQSTAGRSLGRSSCGHDQPLVVTEAVVVRHCPLAVGRFLILISVRGRVDPKAIVRLKGLGRLEYYIDNSHENFFIRLRICLILDNNNGHL